MAYNVPEVAVGATPPVTITDENAIPVIVRIYGFVEPIDPAKANRKL